MTPFGGSSATGAVGVATPPSTTMAPATTLILASPSQTLPHKHLDYVLDMSFDHYGRRFATASGDRTVKVWDLDADGNWRTTCSNEWQAHRGAVHRVRFAHPEFGQLIATAGSDHAVMVWEEREGGFERLAKPAATADAHHHHHAGGGGGNSSGSGWNNRATLSDARRAVTTIEFAPRHHGLRLASGSADGCVRIYEAMDAMNLNHWKLDGVIEAEVVGQLAGDERGTSGGGGGGRSRKKDGGTTAAPESSASNENLGVTSLSWCAGRFEPPTLAIGGSSGRVSLYRYDDAHRSWLESVRLPGHATAEGIPRGVLDVAWAPNVGRSYHLIASCGKDDRLQVHRVKRGRGAQQPPAATGGALVHESTEILDRGQAWRCQWNVTGTVLASSGDGGVVKLWKADFQGRWKCVSDIGTPA